jgi:cytochrome c556
MRRNLKNTAAVVLTCAAAALLVAALAVTSFTTQGQERAPGLTGGDRADDVIMARQLLMDAIDEEMQPIDLAGAGRDTPLDDLKAHATRISNMMPAFGHLFPPQTKPGTPADGSASPTTATTAIWERFDDFYMLVQAAAMAAYDASQAADLKEFHQHGAKLRALCDGCHAQYMKVEQPPPP